MLHHKSVLIIIAVIGLLVAAPSVSSLVPHEIASKVVNKRAPASVVKTSKTMQTINFDCNTHRVETDAQQVRLRGNLCGKFDLSKAKNIQVKNQKLGDSSSLFLLDNKKVTTDYIRLTDGENTISFQQNDQVYELVVVK